MASITPSEKSTDTQGLKTWLLPWNKLTSWVLFFLLVLFAISYWFYVAGLSSFDNLIFDFIWPHITTGRTQVMLAISFLSNTFFLLPAFMLLCIYFLKKKNKQAALTSFIVAASSVILMSALKSLIQRPRPEYRLVEGITNYSFPSGHAFMSIAFYGLFIYWVALSIRNKKAKIASIIFLIMLIFLIGFSRVYLRVHFATDVIAGWSIGTSWLLISAGLVTTYGKRIITL